MNPTVRAIHAVLVEHSRTTEPLTRNEFDKTIAKPLEAQGKASRAVRDCCSYMRGALAQPLKGSALEAAATMSTLDQSTARQGAM